MDDSLSGHENEETDDNQLNFVTALNRKYSCDVPLSIEIHIAKSAPGKTDLGGLIVPEHLALNYSCIVEAGPVSSIADVIRNVTELDLSMNALSQWKEVFEIISHLPKIHFLNLSNNPLSLSRDFVWTGSSFDGIKQLVLNAVKVSWIEIWKLLSVMPQVDELHLSLNEISSVDAGSDPTFPKVSRLFMNGNRICRWQEVERLGIIFPNLSNLVLLGNPLSELSGENPGAHFTSLKSLNLAETTFSSWTELEKLRNFPCLTDAKVLGIPFLEEYEEKLRRFLLIGYLPNVTRLNGSPISATEREDAERAFIRHYLNDENPPSRYGELVGIHGRLDPLVDVNLSASNSVTVTVYFNGKSSLRQFNVRATALDVKKILSKDLVRRPHRAFDVYHNDVGAPHGHSKMNFLQRSLLGYGVNDGDEFYVELKN